VKFAPPLEEDNSANNLPPPAVSLNAHKLHLCVHVFCVCVTPAAQQRASQHAAIKRCAGTSRVQRDGGCYNTLSSNCSPQYEGTWAGLRTNMSWHGTMTDWQRLDAGKVSIGKKRDSHWHPPREHDQASKCRHKRHNCLQTAEEERTYVLQLCSKR